MILYNVSKHLKKARTSINIVIFLYRREKCSGSNDPTIAIAKQEQNEGLYRLRDLHSSKSLFAFSLFINSPFIHLFTHSFIHSLIRLFLRI
jgi:hypothetical protein